MPRSLDPTECREEELLAHMRMFPQLLYWAAKSSTRYLRKLLLTLLTVEALPKIPFSISRKIKDLWEVLECIKRFHFQIAHIHFLRSTCTFIQSANHMAAQWIKCDLTYFDHGMVVEIEWVGLSISENCSFLKGTQNGAKNIQRMVVLWVSSNSNSHFFNCSELKHLRMHSSNLEVDRWYSIFA